MLKLVYLPIAILFCAFSLHSHAQTVAYHARDANQVSYRLGAGDKVKVSVFGSEDLSGEFVVDGDGVLSLPLIGVTAAAGKTVDALTAGVVEKLSDGYLLDPKVTISVVSFRPYYILGEVVAPGEYQYVDDLTVVNAVARAQGYTYRSQRKRVFIKRVGASTEQEYDLDASLVVMPGDTIRIGERHF